MALDPLVWESKTCSRWSPLLSSELEKPLSRGDIKAETWDFPGGTVVKNPPANAGDTGLSPGLGRSHMPQSN